MPSLYANKFVRFERMIWPCVEFKKSFLTATRKKTFWRIFRSFRPTGWSFESYFSPRVHLEKQQLKHGDNLRGFHPRRPRGSQSGWVKRRDESFQAWGGRAPGYRLSPEYFQTVKRMLVSDKAKKKKKMLCIIVPNRRTVSPEFFSWVRTRRLLSHHSCPVRSPSFPNQKRRNYRWVEKRFGCLSAAAIEFALRKFCFWRITMYRK